MTFDARKAIRQFQSGAITFDELKAQFERATYQVRQPTQGDWAEVYKRADELPDGTDVPEALASANYARIITREQKQELIDIYTRKVTAQ